MVAAGQVSTPRSRILRAACLQPIVAMNKPFHGCDGRLSKGWRARRSLHAMRHPRVPPIDDASPRSFIATASPCSSRLRESVYVCRRR